MSYIRGEDRGQAALLPSAIEDYVAADAPVRVIDAFVDGLDVRELGFGRSVPAVTGRPPYDPRDLLKLYVYGYLNEVRSSRRLERECSRNVELMWLLRRLAPDFKTIADFRRDNGAAIVGACRAFVLFCRDQGLFTARLVALDGSKFRAAASAKRVMGRREIAEEATRLDRRIAEYLAALDESDAGESNEEPSAPTTSSGRSNSSVLPGFGPVSHDPSKRGSGKPKPLTFHTACARRPFHPSRRRLPLAGPGKALNPRYFSPFRLDSADSGRYIRQTLRQAVSFACSERPARASI